MAYQDLDANGRIWKTLLTTNDATPVEGTDCLGAIRVLRDGRAFRYTRMTGADGVMGRIYMSATKVTVTDVSAGSTTNGPDGQTTTLITDAAAGWTNDAYIGWYFKVDTGGSGSEEGIKVVGNTAATLTLEKSITTTVVAGDDGEILAGNAAAIVATALDGSLNIVGVGIGTITENYYGWLQVRGIGNVLSTAALSEGYAFSSGGATTAGQAEDRAATSSNYLGETIAAGGTDDYQLVNLRIA